MKIRRKLNLGFGAIILLLWVICAYTIYSSMSVQEILDNLEGDVIPGALAVARMKYEAVDIRHWTLTYIIRGNVIRDGKTIKEWLQKQWTDLEEDAKEHFGMGCRVVPEELQAAKMMVELSHRLISVSSEIVDQKDRGVGNDELFEKVRKELGPVFYPLRRALDEHVVVHYEELSTAQDEAYDEHRANIRYVIIFGLIPTFLALFIGLMVNRLVIRYLAERNQAEEGLRLFSNAVDGSIDGVAMGNSEGKLTYVNNAFCRMFGYSREELTGKEISFLYPRDQMPKLQQALKATMEGGWTGELIALKKGGEAFPISISSSITKDNKGNAIAQMASHRDITERKNAEEKLKQAKEESEAINRQLESAIERANQMAIEAKTANAAKSEFLANMSHEIRTPMNGIIGLTELTLDTDLTEEQRENLRMVKSSADSLLQIINEILDFSKIEAGKLELESIDFSLRGVIESAVEQLSLRAQEKDLELIAFVHPLVPDGVIGDPGRLRQIIMNLTGNAIKFTEEGEIVLRVELESDTAPPGFHFSIADTGIGIPKDKQAAIFDSFTQADGSTTRTYGGTGLGITISKQLVEAMGGIIRMESPINKTGIGGPGSTFHFTAKPGIQERQELPVYVESTEIIGKKALIVDDNATNRQLYEALLRNWSLLPTTASGGREALDLMADAGKENSPYAIVLLDLLMPGMDGFQVAEKIQSSGWLVETAVIMLSSGRRSGDSDRSRQLGVSAFLTKPVRQSTLYDAIVTAVSRQKGAREEVRSPESAIVQTEKSASDLASLEGSCRRVLLAEDNKVNQVLARKLLQKRGYEVTMVENGQQAVEAVKSEEYDVVLMDVQMPVLGGFEATQAIRELEKETKCHIPIIAMTANAMEGDRERCLEAGMDGYVSKPISERKLFEAIAELLSVRGEIDSVSPEAGPPEKSEFFNYSDTLERIGGNMELFNEVISLFLGELPTQIQSLQDAVEKGDAPLVRRLAHTIKGASGNVGGVSLQKAAHQMEMSAEKCDLSQVMKMLEKVRVESVKLREALSNHVTNPA